MSVPTKFVLQQGPALRGMGETAANALKQRLGIAKKNGAGAGARPRSPRSTMLSGDRR